MGDTDYMNPIIPKEDSIVYKFLRKIFSNNGQIVVFRIN